MASEAAGNPSLASRTVCRQIPKVGARCGNSARRDLCGGYAATRIPTAISSVALRRTVRRETGKEYGVKVSDDKDVASHIDPKPCVVARESEGEASVGGHA